MLVNELTATVLRHLATQKSCRRGRKVLSKTPPMALMALLIASILVLPASRALADGQILELPQVAEARPQPQPSRRPRVASPPAEVADAPIPGMGTLQDYEHQDDRPAQNPPQSSASLAMGGSNGAIVVDPGGNRDALINDAILGAVAIGLFALEVHAAHHHRR